MANGNDYMDHMDYNDNFGKLYGIYIYDPLDYNQDICHIYISYDAILLIISYVIFGLFIYICHICHMANGNDFIWIKCISRPAMPLSGPQGAGRFSAALRDAQELRSTRRVLRIRGPPGAVPGRWL